MQECHGLVDAALAFADRGEEADGVGRPEGAVGARRVAAVVSGLDAGGQQCGGVLVPAGAFGDVDQDVGEEPVRDVREQQGERLTGPAVPREQAREERQRQSVSALGMRPGQGDRLFGPAPPFQEPGGGFGGVPPAGRDVGREDLPCSCLLSLLGEQPGLLAGAEPLASAGLERHLVGMAELEEAGDQVRGDAPGPRPRTVVKISRVHG
ncbi:hypothetical protein ACFYYN_35575 [Streptomyces sp. NPDC001902]